MSGKKNKNTAQLNKLIESVAPKPRAGGWRPPTKGRNSKKATLRRAIAALENKEKNE